MDEKIGLAICGKIPDGRHIMDYARNEAKKYGKEFDYPVTGKSLADRLGLYKNAHTLYNSARPFGSTEIIASYDEFEGLGLHMVEHTGLKYGYTACTAGKGRQIAKAEFEKRNFDKLTCREALHYVAKMYFVRNTALLSPMNRQRRRSMRSSSLGSQRRTSMSTNWSQGSCQKKPKKKPLLKSRMNKWLDHNTLSYNIILNIFIIILLLSILLLLIL